MDLRSIGEPVLPKCPSHKIERSPMVLQIQKIKNVAVPSAKQGHHSSSKRLLRLELTDGHAYISAAEIEGPIDKLRYKCRL